MRMVKGWLTTVADFWSKVDVQGPDDCWLWKQSTDRHGYGQTGHDGLHWSAHRLAWQLSNGPIPDGLFVLHHCDNPPCCNPAHLFLGTQADNMADMVSKGRANLDNGRGKPLSEERKRRIADALRGKPKSEGHRQKLAEANRRRAGATYGK